MINDRICSFLGFNKFHGLQTSCFSKKLESLLNPFVLIALFLNPLKASESLTVFWCFQNGALGTNRLHFIQSNIILKSCTFFHERLILWLWITLTQHAFGSYVHCTVTFETIGVTKWSSSLMIITWNS